MTTWTRIGLLLLVTLALPGVGKAQEWTVSTSQPQGGWIGISFDYVKAVVEGREQTVVKILEVGVGSPAEEAGIKAGNTITLVDGQPVSERVFSMLRETLEPGGLVRLTLLEDGRSREVLLRAGEWPEVQYVLNGPNMQQMVIKLDTLRGAILKSLDSARLNISALRVGEGTDGFGFQILRVPPSEESRRELSITYQMNQAHFDSLGFRSGTLVISPDAAMPFEAWVVGSASTDSLRTDLTKLRQELNLVRSQELARRSQLLARGDATEAKLRQDEALEELRNKEQELIARQEQVYERLRRVSEEEMQRRMVEVQLKQEEAPQQAERARSGARERLRDETGRSRATETQVYVEQRSLSPVFVGQNVVLGAQVTPMTPAWAEALQVESGVVVVQVFQDTPASEAGLKDGDVIVQVAGEAVSTIADLRFGVGAFDGPLTIRVMRKGQPTEVVVRR